MAGSVGDCRIVIEGDASQLAFRIGQTVERAIVDRAIRRATGAMPGATETVVTVEDVRSVLEAALLAEACRPFGVVLDVGAKDRSSERAA